MILQSLNTLDLAPSPTNPRKSFPQTYIDELAASIAAQGVIQPITARPWPADKSAAPHAALYEIVAGECRWRASRQAGKQEIPAIVRELSDREVIEFQVIENLQRKDLSELEEGEGYRLMLSETYGYDADELAAKIGKSRTYIYNRLKLTDLCEGARDAFRNGLIDASRAELIARIPVPSLQLEALNSIIDTKTGDPLSYRAAKALIRDRYTLSLKQASFDRTDENLIALAGSCTNCLKCTSNAPELFPDADANVCTDPDCYSAKRTAHREALHASVINAGHILIAGDDATRLLDPSGTQPGAYCDSVALSHRFDQSTSLPAALYEGYTDAQLTYADIIALELQEFDLRRTFIEAKNGTLIECVSRKQIEELLLGKYPRLLEDEKASPAKSPQPSATTAPKATRNTSTTPYFNFPDATPSHNDNQLDSEKNDLFKRSKAEEEQATAAQQAHRAALEALRTLARENLKQHLSAQRVPDMESDIKFMAHTLLAALGEMIMPWDRINPHLLSHWLTDSAEFTTQGDIVKGVEKLIDTIPLMDASAAYLLMLDLVMLIKVELNDDPQLVGQPLPESLSHIAQRYTPIAPLPSAEVATTNEGSGESEASPKAQEKAPRSAPTKAKQKAKAKTSKQAASAASKPKAKAMKSSGSAAGGKAKTATGATAIAYRHPDSGQSWTGRGKQPAWVAEHLAAGGTLDDIRVAA